MKTKEEILKDKGITELTAFHAYPYLYKATIEAMQLYSDQQNKELREERPFRFSPTNSEREWQVKIVNDYIHPNQEDWQKMNAVCNSLIEIQRLTKEVEELRDEQILNDEVEELKNEIIELERQNQQLKRNNDQIIMDSIAQHDELTRLRELLGRSKDYIFLGYVGAVELCDAIDNELNPKP